MFINIRMNDIEILMAYVFGAGLSAVKLKTSQSSFYSYSFML